MEKMHCPKCGSELINGIKRRYETSFEHVMDPNMIHFPLRDTFICGDKSCVCSRKGVFWDDYGEIYGGFRIDFENNLDSAYPSLARKSDIEIYGKGLKKKIYLHPVLMLWILRPIIEFNYKSDEWGNVLKKTWSLKWLRMNGKLFKYHVYYTFPLVHIWKSLKHLWEINKREEITPFMKDHLMKFHFLDIPKWDKRWWRHAEVFISKIIFKKLYNKIKNE